MPINITPTVNNDGYIIEDANHEEHFFYQENGELVYDGWTRTLSPKMKEDEEILENLRNIARDCGILATTSTKVK